MWSPGKDRVVVLLGDGGGAQGQRVASGPRFPQGLWDPWQVTKPL